MVAQLSRDYIRTSPLRTLRRLVSYVLFEGRALTTKGRWINPFLFALHRSLARLPALGPVDRPLFLVGIGRSGTTVTGVIFSMHPDVGFLNEPRLPWHVIHPGEDTNANYSREPARFVLEPEEASETVRRRAHRIFGDYLRLTGSRRLFDKYMEHVYRVPFVRAIFPDARFLFLSRDGPATIQSIDLWSDRKGVDAGRDRHDWWGENNRKWHLMLEQLVPRDPDLAPHAATIAGFDEHRDMAATEWILAMRAGLRASERWPDAVYHQRYEDLAGDPAEALPPLLEFLELSPERRFLDFATRTLRPAVPVEPLPLHPVLAGPFEATRRALGYSP